MLRSKGFSLALVITTFLIAAQPAAAASPPSVPGAFVYGASATWDTYVTADNATNGDVVVPLSDSPVGPAPSITVPANATRIADRVCSGAHDCASQYGAIETSIPTGLELTSSFRYHGAGGTTAAFDVPFLTYAAALQKYGDYGVLRGLRNDGSSVVTLVAVNKGSTIAFLTLTIVDGDNHWRGVQYVTTPLGLITTGVSIAFDVGRVYVQLGDAVGASASFGTHYVFAVDGPASGTSQRVVLLERGLQRVIVNGDGDSGASVLLLPRTNQ